MLINCHFPRIRCDTDLIITGHYHACGFPNENGPHRLMKSWSSVGGTIGKGLGDVVLLEEGCHCGGL